MNIHIYEFNYGFDRIEKLTCSSRYNTIPARRAMLPIIQASRARKNNNKTQEVNDKIKGKMD
jgi:hypothetical protein